jgi:hypothetical protein
MSDTIYWVIAFLMAFLNVYLILRLRSKKVKSDGEIVVRTDLETGKKVFSLEIYKSPEEIESMETVSFRINSQNGV